jgi:hypothetical protein
MKTSIVASAGGGRFRRAIVPGEVGDEYIGVPRFREAHTETFDRVVSMNPWRTKAGSQKVPDRLHIRLQRYEFEKGKVDLVRVIPAEYVEELDAKDHEIRRLERERRELIEEAFRHGKPITKAQAQEWQAQKAAEVKS